MAGRIPQKWLDELYSKANIVDVVSRYVHLKRDGKRHWGLCPFHNEKTPSFSVGADTNLYYCFGCKAGGNVIQFVMEMEHMSYAEAALYLGEQLHMPPPEIKEDPEWEKKRSIRDKLHEINTMAARFFHATLWKPQGEKALQYLYSRGLTDAVIRKFGLGAAPDAWDALLEHLKANGYAQEDIFLAGLCVKKESGCYDMFRNRVIFPIIDERGQINGFGGRIMSDQKPKYLNTSDTPIFNKRLGVFAAKLIKEDRSLKRILLTEGYMDVISLWQMGITGAVATLGTSLTVEQARLLHRFCPDIWICYDGDEPGQHAIERAIGIFNQEQIPVKVVQLPPGIDPDEYVRQYGKEAFQKINPISAVQFLMQRVLNATDLSDVTLKAEAAKKCAEILKGVKNPVDLEVYVEFLAFQTGFSKEILYSQIGVSRPAPVQAHFAAAQRDQHYYSVRQENGPDKKNKAFKAEQRLLCLLLLNAVPPDSIKTEDFSYSLFIKTAEMIMRGMNAGQILESIEDNADRQLLNETFTLCAQDLKDENAKALQDCLRTLRISKTEKTIEELKAQLRTITDADQRRLMMQDIARLMKELSELKKSSGNS